MKLKKPIIKSSKGFTVTELLIATTIFSVILLLCTFGLIQVGRTYYKGVTIIRTQNVARSVMDNVSQSIIYSGSTPSIVPNALCIGSMRFSYSLNNNVGPGVSALKYDDNNTGGCSSNMSIGKELLAENMRLIKFNVTPAGNDYLIEIAIAYGPTDLTIPSPSDPTTKICKSDAGTQFCATSELKTTVTRRIN